MPLTHLGLIAASGPDAADFLHNQLTNDVLKLGSDEARLAGYCSPKGRLLATFLMWRSVPDTIYLQCGKDLQPAMQKRLSMFVLRAKAKLLDVSTSFQTFGLIGAKARPFLQQHFEQLPEQVWQTVHGTSGTLIRFANGVAQNINSPRWLWLAPADQSEVLNQAASQTLNVIPIDAASALWRWLDITAGLPQITPATQDRFVPQMINFEALGGVNFKKGCYPGQEVVARSQYLGKLKRRMAVGHMAELPEAEWPAPGADVFEAARPAEPIGTVVNLEASPLGGLDVLLELPQALLPMAGGPGVTDQPEASPIIDTSRHRIELRALPYTLPDQEIFVRPKL